MSKKKKNRHNKYPVQPYIYLAKYKVKKSTPQDPARVWDEKRKRWVPIKADLEKKIAEREQRLAREKREAQLPNTWLKNDLFGQLDSTWSQFMGKATARPVSRPPEPVANRRLYFAYGSNLQASQMAHRCPGSTFLYKHALEGFRLEFQKHANIVEGSETDAVVGAIFLISPSDEHMLDRYEGVKHGAYEKKTFRFFTPKGNWRDVLYYQKKPGLLMPPTDEYLKRIVDGYKKLGIDNTPLYNAVDEAGFAAAERETVLRQSIPAGNGALNWEVDDEEPINREGAATDIWEEAQDNVFDGLDYSKGDPSDDEFDALVREEVKRLLKERYYHE